MRELIPLSEITQVIWYYAPNYFLSKSLCLPILLKLMVRKSIRWFKRDTKSEEICVLLVISFQLRDTYLL